MGIVPAWAASGRMWSRRLISDVGYTQPLTEAWSIRLNATHNFWEHNVHEPPGPFFEGGWVVTTDAMLLEGVLQGRLGERGGVLVGGLSENRSNRDTLVPSYDEWLYSGHASADYRFIDPLKLIAGFQYNRAAQDKQAWVPRLGTIYSFTGDITLKLLYGRAFRVATPLEEYLIRILPERGEYHPHGTRAGHPRAGDCRLLRPRDGRIPRTVGAGQGALSWPKILYFGQKGTNTPNPLRQVSSRVEVPVYVM